MQHNKVLIIGIDGATFDIIRPMAEGGELPNIASLMKSGVSADLQSTTPPITAPAWTSFMTGTSPGKHGIFTFIGDTHKTYSGRVLSAADSKSQSLWTLLSKAKKRLTLLNIPFTYPPLPINGIMIPGMGAPSASDEIAFPSEVYKTMLRDLGGYKVDHPVGDIFNDQDGAEARADELIARLHDMEIKRTDAALYLLEKYDCDLFMIVYVLTDRVQHLFWKFMDTAHPGHDPVLAKRYRQTIADGYRAIDREIGRLLQKVGEEVTVVIMSDHGFGPLHKCFYINNWLIQNGLMKLKRTLPWKFKLCTIPLPLLLNKLRLRTLSNLIPQVLAKLAIPIVRRRPKAWNEFVDWSRTKAYAADPLGVSINLKGREPQGIVGDDDLEALLIQVREQLGELKDPETGELVVDRVMRNTEAYSGPATQEAPDLLISLKGLSYLPSTHLRNSKNLFAVPQNDWSGTHRFNGIFIMKGEKIRESLSLKDVKIIDVAPTVLHLFNLPVPGDMDGCVIESAFQADEILANPVTYDNRHGEERDSGEALSEEDEQKVRCHLKSLGYL